MSVCLSQCHIHVFVLEHVHVSISMLCLCVPPEPCPWVCTIQVPVQHVCVCVVHRVWYLHFSCCPVVWTLVFQLPPDMGPGWGGAQVIRGYSLSPVLCRRQGNSLRYPWVSGSWTLESLPGSYWGQLQVFSAAGTPGLQSEHLGLSKCHVCTWGGMCVTVHKCVQMFTS